MRDSAAGSQDSVKKKRVVRGVITDVPFLLLWVVGAVIVVKA